MGVNPVFYAVVALLNQYFDPRFSTKMQLLIFQIRMLRDRINTLMIVPTPKERAELMRLGEILDHDVNGFMFVVFPSTYKKSIRDKRRGKNWVMPGRKGAPEVIRRLLCIMTESNPLWGRRRIVGELRKLGIRIGATTVRDLLKAMGPYPEPTKGWSKRNIPWRTFIEANKKSMLATDFFSKNIWIIWGKRQLYFLAYIHIGSRRVYCSVGTYSPDDHGIMQSCRKLFAPVFPRANEFSNEKVWIGKREAAPNHRGNDIRHTDEDLWRTKVVGRGENCSSDTTAGNKGNFSAGVDFLLGGLGARMVKIFSLRLNSLIRCG